MQGKDLQSIVENASRRVILLGSAAVVVSVCHSTSLAQALQDIEELASGKPEAASVAAGLATQPIA